MAQQGGVVSDVSWIITLFLLGAIGVLIIKNPIGFSASAGTIFSGFNSWGQTLTGSGYSGGH
jgi:hypothetical protein